ncbi:MAG: MBL fold metallo-hydrolase [Bacillaceae bacterium]|nr:MBL fold metallo-hydrolase [Bacillaceae bacterium]
MDIMMLPLGALATNAYVIKDNQGRGIVIDPAQAAEPLVQAVQDLSVEAILLTHAHFDHIAGLNEIRELTGAPVYIHPSEQDWLADPMKNGSARWPEVGGPVQCERADYELADGQELNLLGRTWKVRHTPGHSPGGVSFITGDYVFSGDALFAGSIGRTDLPGGDYEQLITSIQDKLMVLLDETVVYPGHGPQTTIGSEKEHNPFITGLLR